MTRGCSGPHTLRLHAGDGLSIVHRIHQFWGHPIPAEGSNDESADVSRVIDERREIRHHDRVPSPHKQHMADPLVTKMKEVVVLIEKSDHCPEQSENRPRSADGRTWIDQDAED